MKTITENTHVPLKLVAGIVVAVIAAASWCFKVDFTLTQIKDSIATI